LYLIHFPIAFQFTGLDLPVMVPYKNNRPIFAKVSIQETWQAMEELVAAGLVKSIGVSNFSNAQLQDLLTYAKIPPAVNQIETQPYFTRTPLFDNCLANQCQLMAYSPLGSGQVGPLQDETVAKIAKLHSKVNPSKDTIS